MGSPLSGMGNEYHVGQMEFEILEKHLQCSRNFSPELKLGCGWVGGGRPEIAV